MLVGRRPAGMSLVPGVDLSHLYSELRIPASWISIKDMANEYRQRISEYRRFAGSGPKRSITVDTFKREFVFNGSIDFGLLDLKRQIDVLKSIFKNKTTNVTSINSNCRNEFSITENSYITDKCAQKDIIAQNSAGIMRCLGEKAFEKNFSACFCSTPPKIVSRKMHTDVILRTFAQLKAFRLLMDF
jgi:hypothetical protein